MFCRDSFTQVKQIIGIIFTSRTMKNSHRLFHTENTNEVGHFVSFVFDLSTGRIDLMDTNQMGLDNSVFYSRALLNDFFRDLHLSLIASDCSTPQPYCTILTYWTVSSNPVSYILRLTDGQIERECGCVSLALVLTYIVTFDHRHRFKYSRTTLQKLRNFLFVQWASGENHIDLLKSVFLQTIWFICLNTIRK